MPSPTWLTLLLLAACNLQSRADESAALRRLTHDGHFKQRPAWSPDGKQLVFARHRGATILLYVRSADGAQERRLIQQEQPQFDAVFSPNGKQLLLGFDKASPNQGDIEVYRVDPDGRNLTPVAVTQGKLSHEESPCWSPDGNRIAYTSTRHGNQELYVANADGTEETRLTNDPAIDAHPAWSPDGRRIAFTTNRWGDLELALIDPDGKNLLRLTESPGLDDYPAWSPDGQWVALTSNRDGNLEIYVTDSEGKQAHNATSHPALDNFPTWTPAGQLTFVSNRNGGFDVYLAKQPWGLRVTSPNGCER